VSFGRGEVFGGSVSAQVCVLAASGEVEEIGGGLTAGVCALRYSLLRLVVLSV
jgi:hypothetical protein